MRNLLLSLGLAGAALPAVAAEPNAIETYGAWAARARDELVLDGHRPYRVIVGAHDRASWTASAEFGSLFAENEDRSRRGVVEVVVGSPARDSSRFTSRNQQVGGARSRPGFVVEDVPFAIERDLWLTTDASFKAAVQRFEQKVSALEQLPTAYPADWTPATPVESLRYGARAPFDRDALRRLAVEGSAAFREVPGLRSGWVEVVVEQGDVTVVTSEGVRVVQPEERAVVYAWCDLVRPDGVQLYEEIHHLVATPDGLPNVDALRTELLTMARRVAARASAPVVEAYEGPVVFEGAASAQLFAWLLQGELEGTPPDPRPGATWEQLLRGGPRIGRRVLPEGWSVWDDPAAFPEGVPGGFEYDLQGAKAERVDLVRDGYVVDLVMDRVPRPDRPGTNGHARGAIQGEWEARLSAWTVEPDRLLSERAFDKAVDRARRSAELERVLVVRAFQRNRPGSLPRPTDAVWRYPDGHEEPVLSLSFQNTNRRTLKDILAVGGGRFVRSWLASIARGGTDGTTTGLPMAITVPRLVLVDDLELSYPGSDRPADTFPMPPL